MAAAMVQVNVRIEPTLYSAFKKQAQRNGENVTAAVNAAIRAYVREGNKG